MSLLWRSFCLQLKKFPGNVFNWVSWTNQTRPHIWCGTYVFTGPQIAQDTKSTWMNIVSWSPLATTGADHSVETVWWGTLHLSVTMEKVHLSRRCKTLLWASVRTQEALSFLKWRHEMKNNCTLTVWRWDVADHYWCELLAAVTDSLSLQYIICEPVDWKYTVHLVTFVIDSLHFLDACDTRQIDSQRDALKNYFFTTLTQTKQTIKHLKLQFHKENSYTRVNACDILGRRVSKDMIFF